MVLSKETLVPVGVVVTACGLILGAHLYLSGQFAALSKAQSDAALAEVEARASLSAQLGAMDRRMERIEESMERAAGDRWTARDQKQWATELARRNPSLDVPSPEPFRPR